MDNNHDSNQSPKIPSPTAQSNNSQGHSPHQNSFQTFPVLNSYQHNLAIQIMAKISTRTYYRQFLKKFTFAYIFSLKEEKQQVKTVYVPTPTTDNSQLVQWPYKELYYQKNRTIQQEQLLQFVNLCATMIQANFKGYITQKRHKIALGKYRKVQNSLQNFALIWKSRRVYNCKRCYEIRQKYRQIQKQIDEEEDNPKRDVRKLKFLHEYLEFNAIDFRETYEKLYSNGMWVLQANMNPMQQNVTKKISYPLQPIQKQTLQEVQKSKPRTRKRQFQKKQNQNQMPQKSIKTNFESNLSTNQFEERPIVAKGQYTFNEDEVIQTESQVNKEVEEVPKQKQKQEKKAGNPHKNEQLEKLKKRQKYDPRKAIEEGKKKKKEVKSEPEKVEKKEKIKTEESVNEKKEESPKKKKIVLNGKKGEKQGHKRVQSKVDCWVNNKKETDKEWVRQIKERLAREVEKQEQEQKMQKIKVSPKKYQYIQKKQQIEQMERQQYEEKLRRNESNHQLKNRVRQMVEKNNMNKKKQVYRPVEELEETYSKHYGDRYQNLMPKLGLLSVARGTEHESGIPVIDSYSEEFNLELKEILQIATRMEKNFKQFITQ